jgi:hypothetical protein
MIHSHIVVMSDFESSPYSVPMITLRYPNYISAFPLAEVMPVLLKEDLLWMAGQFGMTVSKNQKKEVIAQMVSEYLLTHPKEEEIRGQILFHK